jgi:hypothetical protein
VPGPITFGVTRPVIVLPADANEWPEADLRRAIVHELEHIQRCDWIVLLAARSICACYWFHPLAWMAWRQLSLEAERSCDDAVVLIEERTDYAEQLVTLAQRLSATQEAPMLGMANRSDLSTRVTAVLDDRQRRGRAGLGLVAGAVAAAGLIVIGVAPLTAVARVEAVTTQSQDAADRAKLIEALRAAEADDNKARAAERRTLLEKLRAAQRERPRVRALDRALYEAANEGDLEQVNEILAAGGNANAVVYGDGSPLIAAARDGNMTIVRRLIDAGADPNLPVEGDGSPLIQASAAGNLDVVRYLVDRGADVNLAVEGDENPLMCAAEQGHLKVVQYLVERGANVNERIWSESSGRGGRVGEWRTAVSQATKNRHTAVVQYLMSVGARE